MDIERNELDGIVSKLILIETLVRRGVKRTDALRQIGITERKYNRWRKQYGGMDNKIGVKELKRLQGENERLRRDVFDLTLDNFISMEAFRGKKITMFFDI